MEQGLQQKYELAKRAYKDLQKLQWVEGLYFKDAHFLVNRPQEVFNVLSKYFEEPKVPIKTTDVASVVSVADDLVKTLDKTIEYLGIIRLQFRVQLERTVRDYNERMGSLKKSFYELMAQRAVENLSQATTYAKNHGIGLSGKVGTKEQSSNEQKNLDLLGQLAIATSIPEGNYEQFENIIREYHGILGNLTTLSEEIEDTSLDSTRLDDILLRNILNDGFEKDYGITINDLIIDLNAMRSGKSILDGLR